MKSSEVLGLAGWLLVTFAASAAGAIASVNAGEFYGQLQQPEWAPPAWLFGPVWTVLYALMGVAAWLVWRAGGFRERAVALGLFVTQLLLNALWSWLFFAWKLGGWAFAEVVLLWVMILVTGISFRQASSVAALLLAPYLLWVTFAAVLNLTLWRMNPVLL